MRPFLLTLHISGVLLAIGPTMAGPFIGISMEKAGAEGAKAIATMFRRVERGLIIPGSTLLIPGPGAGLIVTQGWQPWPGGHNWLFTAIVLYVIGYLIGIFGHGRNLEKQLALLDEGKYQGPEWERIGKREQVFGMASFLIVFAILTLMVWKPNI